MEAAAGIEDLDADEAVVFQSSAINPADSGRQVGLDGGAAGCERVAGEVDVVRVRGGVLGDPHLDCASPVAHDLAVYLVR